MWVRLLARGDHKERIVGVCTNEFLDPAAWPIKPLLARQGNWDTISNYKWVKKFSITEMEALMQLSDLDGRPLVFGLVI
eukprot:8191683-Karenia_brevis.AAC.1